MVTAEQYRLNSAIKNYIADGGLSEVQVEDILKDMEYDWKLRSLFDITDPKVFRAVISNRYMDLRLLWTIRKLVFMIKNDEYNSPPKWSPTLMNLLEEKW